MPNIFSKTNLILLGVSLATIYAVNNTMLRQYIKPNG